MRALFKKNKEIRISPRYYLLLRDRWAKKMSALTLHVSRQGLVFYLIVFVGSTGSLSVYSIYRSLCAKEYKNGGTPISPDHIIVVKSSLNKTHQTRILETGSYNSTRFKGCQELGKGKKIRDTLQDNRPGLLDSLACNENYSKSNLKK